MSTISIMTKSIAMLIVHRNQLADDLLDKNLEYLSEKIILLNYHVSKISIINFEKDLIVFELINLLKQNHFVILVDKLQTLFTFKYLCEVFNFGDSDNIANYPQYSKLLKYDNLIKLKPVIYLNRLFIIQDTNLKLVYENILKDHLKQFNRKRMFTKNIKLNTIHLLDTLAKKDFDVEVKIIEQQSTSTIQLQSSNFSKLVDYQRCLQNKILDHYCLDTYYLEDLYNSSFNHIQQAIECIKECFSEYGLDNVFISFNGGKDCTVLLDLVLSILRSQYPDYKNPVVCMYVQSTNPFPEVNNFIDMLRDYYSLDIVTITKGVREGLESFLETRRSMKACLMGTRRSDPYSENLQIFQMTDHNWPQVMRVSPLLDWHYSEIWDYLLYHQVPYCSLYDEGYTSLGSVHNTVKNPNLLYKMYKDFETYLPAYKLLDGSTERSGRI